MYGALDVSTSGLIAQRTRLTLSSVNVANSRTLLNADGEYEPFRRRFAVLQAGDPEKGEALGVHIASIKEDDGDLKLEYEPTSPFADADGYVGYPNVNSVIETMNAMEALRSYEANVTAVEATKSLMSVALKMLA